MESAIKVENEAVRILNDLDKQKEKKSKYWFFLSLMRTDGTQRFAEVKLKVESGNFNVVPGWQSG